MNSNDNNETKKVKKETKKSKKIKCNQCSKKLGMIFFTCKCDHVFCSTHLNPHSHNCTYDYKGEKKKELVKNNPKVENNSFNKI